MNHTITLLQWRIGVCGSPDNVLFQVIRYSALQDFSNGLHCVAVATTHTHTHTPKVNEWLSLPSPWCSICEALKNYCISGSNKRAEELAYLLILGILHRILLKYLVGVGVQIIHEWLKDKLET